MPPLRRENTFATITNAAGGLGSVMWNFFALLISLLPTLGARVMNLLALTAIVFPAIMEEIARY